MSTRRATRNEAANRGPPSSKSVCTLSALAADGVQTLLLEGGPRLAASFLAAGLVDKLLVFVAPRLAGEGAGPVAALPDPVQLRRLKSETVGEDLLLTAYVQEP